jgi:hypothetical protein
MHHGSGRVGQVVVTEVRLAARFNGPVGSANGGYVSGTVAQLVGEGPVQVRLHRPPPLDRPLQWMDGRLLDATELIAEGSAFAGETPRLPAAVTVEAAAAASANFRGLTRHPFPSCFGCGPDRTPGGGLRIFAGALPGGSMLAAPWVPHPSLAADGVIPIPVVWAALDCPGGWVVLDDGTSLLGTMRAHVVRPVATGESLIVSAWPLGVDGRKRYTGSALHSAAGELVGWSQQTWIELR